MQRLVTRAIAATGQKQQRDDPQRMACPHVIPR
jgi:hypothetical protein